MRTRICGALVVIAALGVVTPVTAKEGMTATLLGHVPVHAKAGTTVTVAWRIRDKAAHAADQGTMYVRVYSARGHGSTRALGSYAHRGYAASVRVPSGGIGDIKIFLVGWMYKADGSTRRADMEIPITNDPFSKRAGHAARAGRSQAPAPISTGRSIGL